MTGHWQIPFLSTTAWRMIFCLVTATLLIACSALPNASGTTLVSSRHPNKSLLTLVSRYLQASSHGAFCSKWRSCQEPFHCDLFMGSGDFGLGVCKQQAPLGKPCGTDKFMCASGGVCKTGYGGTLCRSVVPAGGVCTDPRATLCEDKLECQKGKCVKSVGYAVACTSTYTQCRPGLVCDKICKVHVSLGGYCGYDNSVCHDGLTCYGEGYHGKFCSRFLGHNQVCNGEHVHCNTGFKCVKAGSVNRCVAGLSKGHVCGTESRYCLPELTCHAWGNSKRCVAIMDRDQDCSGSFMLCKGAARCVGESGQKRCRVAKNKGEDCSLDRNGYAFCGYGLRCYKYAGAGKCFQQMKENGDCSGQYMACHAGFHCVGDPGKQQCRKALPQGSSCVSPYNKCDHNLICHGEGAEAFCYAVVGYKGDCSAKYAACQAGLECRGPDTKKLCLRPLAKGGVCDGIYRFCGTGLECTLIGKGKRCASIMGEGGGLLSAIHVV